MKFSHLFKTSGLNQESLKADIEEEIQKDGQGYIVSSNLSFTPRPVDDHKFILCLSQHDTFLREERVGLAEIGSSLCSSREPLVSPHTPFAGR